MSVVKDENLIYEAKSYDRRFSGRKMSLTVQTESVMLEWVRMAQNTGICAKYILFDSWVTSQKTISALKTDHNLNTIAMIKKNKTKYIYGEESLNVQQIYSETGNAEVVTISSFR